jgi:hypothetical protein
VLASWKKYFRNILSVPTAPERLQLTSERTDNYDEVEPPAYYEICSIINKRKTNKAAGTDNIPGELIQHGGRTLKQKIYKLIKTSGIKKLSNLNGTKEISAPSVRKCNRLDCNNYRPITLLNINYNIQSYKQ